MGSHIRHPLQVYIVDVSMLLPPDFQCIAINEATLLRIENRRQPRVRTSTKQTLELEASLAHTQDIQTSQWSSSMVSIRDTKTSNRGVDLLVLMTGPQSSI